MNLNTGQVIARTVVKAFPVTKSVQDKAEQMARDQNMNFVEFTNEHGVLLPDQDHEPGIDCKPDSCNDVHRREDRDEDFQREWRLAS